MKVGFICEELFPQNNWYLNSENLGLIVNDVISMVLKKLLGTYSVQKQPLFICQAYFDGRGVTVLCFLGLARAYTSALDSVG